MIIDVSKMIKLQGETMDVVFSENIQSIKTQSSTLKVLEPIELQGVLTSDGAVLYFKGKLKAKLEFHCDRCMKPMIQTMHIELDEQFSGSDLDDEEVNLITGGKIDFTPVLINAILLHIPMKTVCDENCKGICPQCGQNLNEKRCSCDDQDIDPRFAILESLFDKQ